MYVIGLLFLLIVICSVSLLMIERFRGGHGMGPGGHGGHGMGPGGHRGHGRGHSGHGQGIRRPMGGSSYGGAWGYGYPFIWWGYPYYYDSIRCDTSADCGGGFCDQFGFCEYSYKPRAG